MSKQTNELRYFVLHKPYGYLSQFTDNHNKSKTLAELYNFPKDVYAVGRLDKDSEGLLLLTNDKALNHRLLSPKFKHWRSYWALVEGFEAINDVALSQLENGVQITSKQENYITLPAKARLLNEDEMHLAERNPLPRIKHVAKWIELSLTEGKNRQVRKMTAAVGFPTLRLVRVSIEGLKLGNLAVGAVKEYPQKELYKLLGIPIG